MSGAHSTGRIALIAALPREVAGLVRGWEADKQHHHRGVYTWRSPGALVVAAGMGAVRAALAVEAALACGDVCALVSIGLAGACAPMVAVGSVLHVAEVVDVRTGERFRTSEASERTEARIILATGNSIASVREKARLFATYSASAVDMEAATVARLALAHGLPFRAVKAISDDFSFELGSLSRFTTHHGHFHTRAFALHTAVRPHTWRKTVRLGRHSAAALRALQSDLEQMLRSDVHPTG